MFNIAHVKTIKSNKKIEKIYFLLKNYIFNIKCTFQCKLTILFKKKYKVIMLNFLICANLHMMK